MTGDGRICVERIGVETRSCRELPADGGLLLVGCTVLLLLRRRGAGRG
jgi:hypothetical protein